MPHLLFAVLAAPLENFDRRQPQLQGEKLGRQTVRGADSDLTVSYDRITGSPRLITAKGGALSSNAGLQAAAAGAAIEPQQAVERFVAAHRDLFGHGPENFQAGRAALVRSFETPHNRLRSISWQQRHEGIAVQDALFLAHLDARGRLVRISSRFLPNAQAAALKGAPGLPARPSAPEISAERAIEIAAGNIGAMGMGKAVAAQSADRFGSDHRQEFRAAGLRGAARARLVWLPLGPDSARLCWRVELQAEGQAETYRLFIDTATGGVLVRRSLTVSITDSTFQVFPSDSPSPFSPGFTLPEMAQPLLGHRQRIKLSALSTNASPAGWIDDGINETIGNNVDAHTDHDGDDQPDLPRPSGRPRRIFDFPLDLSQPPASYANASVVQLFYWNNWMHDRLYDLGFTEAAGNFQELNYGRGGEENDPIMADAQDGGGFNNANMTVPEDGIPGRMQMYLFDGPKPHRDGSLDADIVLHEYAHGLTIRMVAGGDGLYSFQGAGLGEGWSDFYAIAMLSEPHDDPQGAYPAGAYASYQLGGLEENYYYGIRRYPYSIDLRKNPLTFKDIDPSQASRHSGVPRNPIYGDSYPANEVHAQGEVWCSALWEARAGLIAKHGYAIGNQMILQLVTDALRLTPPEPTFLEARDAIIEADLVNNGGANAEPLWAAFAKRGMGFSAEAPPSMTTLGVIESFDVPDDLLFSPVRPFVASGPVGGPFLPAQAEFTLRNASTNHSSWTASVSGPWLELRPSAGEIAPGGPDQALSLAFSPLVARLPAGVYRDDLTVSNRLTGKVQTRKLSLRVGQPNSLTFAFTQPSGAAAFQQASATFTPEVSASGYRVCYETAAMLPTDTSSGAILDVGDDNFVKVDFPEGKSFRYFGIEYTNVFVCGNGYLTFGKGATDFDSSLETHFALPRISAFATDLNTFFGGSVAVLHFPDRLAVTYNSIPTYFSPTPNTFQVELFLDGAIRITWLETETYLGVVGLSPGGGVPAEFAPADFPSAGNCIPILAVSAPVSLREDAGTLSGKAMLPAPINTNLALRAEFRSGADSLATNLLIEAGYLEAAFTLPVRHNPVLEGTRLARLVVTAPGFREASAEVAIHDAEQGALNLVLPERAAEGSGLLSARGLVRLAQATPEPIVIRLSSSDPVRVAVPEICIVLTNQLTAEFPVTVLEDNRIDRDERVSVIAQVENWASGADSIDISDNEARVLALALPKTAGENAGVLARAGVVSAAGILDRPLTVRLQSSRDDLLSPPAEVVILPGASNAIFNLESRDDSLATGVLPIHFRAESEGFETGAATIQWSDDETPAQPSGPNPRDASASNSPQSDLSWAVANGEGIADGGFESGSLAEWRMEGTGGGRFLVNDGTVDPDGPGGAILPLEGRFSVVAEQSAPGRIALWQEVSIPEGAVSARLRWSDRIQNHAALFDDRYQSFRVEVQSSAGEVLGALYQTREGDPLQAGWTAREVDLRDFVGRQIRLVFVLDATFSYFNVHLDQVSLEIRSAPVDRFRVYLGPSPKLSSENLAAITSESFLALPPLELNRSFYWQVVAENSFATNVGPVWQFFVPPAGTVERIEWSQTPAASFAGAKMAATLTALDRFGTVTPFGGQASLRGIDQLPDVTVGLPSESWDYPLGGFFPVMRLQSIYLASELGPARRLTGLALKVARPPGEVARWTLRLKHSNRQSYTDGDAAWEGSGWTTVVQRNLSIDQAGWVQIPFSTPFDYDGTNHLLADFSFKNPGFGAHGGAFATITGQDLRSITGLDISGDPLTWPARQFFQLQDKVPHASFLSEREISVLPAIAGPFTNGVWAGSVTILEPGDSVRLEADVSEGQGGSTQPIAVRLPNDLRLLALLAPSELVHRSVAAFEFQAFNPGPLAARSVTLTSVFSGRIAFESATITKGTIATNGFQAAADVGELAPGESVYLRLGVLGQTLGPVTNLAFVTRQELDASPGNDSLRVVSTIVEAPVISGTDPVISEGARSNLVFELTLSRAISQAVSVRYLVKPGTATSEDFEPASGTIEFPPGARRASIAVRVKDDATDEEDESLFLELVADHGAAIATSQPRATILDDDGPRVSIEDAAVLEGTGVRTNMLFVVRLDTNSAQRIEVDWSTNPGSAAETVDFIRGSGKLVFAPGITERTIAVAINPDSAVELRESFFVTLGAASGARLGRVRAEGTILDDDGLPGNVHSFVLDPPAPPLFVGEPFLLSMRALDLSGGPAWSFNGTAGLSASVPATGIEIGSGGAEFSGLFDASINDCRVQAIYLASEVGAARDLTALGLRLLNVPSRAFDRFTIRLRHTTLSKYPLTPRWESGWTVVYQAQQAFSSTGLTTFVFSRPFPFDGLRNLMVDFSFRNGNHDYRMNMVAATDAGAERCIAGRSDLADGDPLNWNGTSPYPITHLLLPDIQLQGAHPVPLSLSKAEFFTNGVWSGPVSILAPGRNIILEARSGERVGRLSSIAIEVRDDLQLQVDAKPDPITVGDTLEVTMAVTNHGPGLSRLVSVRGRLPESAVLLTNSAQFGTFRHVGEELVWELPELPGGAGAVAQIQLRVPAMAANLSGAFTAERAEPDSYPANNTSTWQARVLDRPGVSVFAASALEGSARLEVPVQLTGPSSRSVSVDYAIFNGTATSADYILENGRLVFPPGTTQLPVRIPLIVDSADEPDESVLVSIYNAENAAIVRALAECFIVDDDGPELIVSTQPAREGHSGRTIHPVEMRLSSPSVQRISFDLKSVSATARAGSDFDPAAAHVVFAPGETTNLSFSIAILGDLQLESNESLFIAVTNLTNATVARDRFELQILNDDGLPGELQDFVFDLSSTAILAGKEQFITILARDSYRNRAAGFSGPATLSSEAVADRTVGEGTESLQAPLGNYGPSKLQTIYRADEIGRALILDAISLEVNGYSPYLRNSISGLTIRLKHSQLASFSPSGIWETNQWTSVLENSVIEVNASGWLRIPFDRPFAYDGTNHLMIDFNLGSEGVSWQTYSVFGTKTEQHRSLSSSGYFDAEAPPVLWSGRIAFPIPLRSVPNIQFHGGEPILAGGAPEILFEKGVWVGSRQFAEPAQALRFRVSDALGHSSASAPFLVASPLDSDADGLPDAWERLLGLDPENPADAAADQDRDGASNLDEFSAGTSAADPRDALSLYSVRHRDGRVVLEVFVAPGRSYLVERAEGLGGNWTPLVRIPAAESDLYEVTDPVPAGTRQHFYRVRLD